jgi:hypothetical protein
MMSEVKGTATSKRLGNTAVEANENYENLQAENPVRRWRFETGTPENVANYLPTRLPHSQTHKHGVLIMCAVK